MALAQGSELKVIVSFIVRSVMKEIRYKLITSVKDFFLVLVMQLMCCLSNFSLDISLSEFLDILSVCNPGYVRSKILLGIMLLCSFEFSTRVSN